MVKTTEHKFKRGNKMSQKEINKQFVKINENNPEHFFGIDYNLKQKQINIFIADENTYRQLTVSKVETLDKIINELNKAKKLLNQKSLEEISWDLDGYQRIAGCDSWENGYNEMISQSGLSEKEFIEQMEIQCELKECPLCRTWGGIESVHKDGCTNCTYCVEIR